MQEKRIVKRTCSSAGDTVLLQAEQDTCSVTRSVGIGAMSLGMSSIFRPGTQLSASGGSGVSCSKYPGQFVMQTVGNEVTAASRCQRTGRQRQPQGLVVAHGEAQQQVPEKPSAVQPLTRHRKQATLFVARLHAGKKGNEQAVPINTSASSAHLAQL